jgi:hypothetical protein
MRLTPERCEIAKVRLGHECHVAALAAVAAVRSPLRDELLPPKAERAIPAASCLHVDPSAIVEHQPDAVRSLAPRARHASPLRQQFTATRRRSAEHERRTAKSL